jgi:hypothetical protein
MNEASAALWPARAALISAPRRKPVKRSTLAESEVLRLRLEVFPLRSCPVAGSIREGPSEAKALAEELAESDGRNDPQALRRCAAAVWISHAARTTAGCTRSDSLMASASVTVRSWPWSRAGRTADPSSSRVATRERVMHSDPDG